MINPYYIVKQAKRTELTAHESYGGGYDDSGTWVPAEPHIRAQDYYTPKELPFFNKYWIPLPNKEGVHLTEFSLPLIGGLIGAYTGKGTFNKIKNGLIGALAGAGVHSIANYSGLRQKLVNSLVNMDKPFASLWDKEVSLPFDRAATNSEAKTFWDQNPADPLSFKYNIND